MRSAGRRAVVTSGLEAHLLGLAAAFITFGLMCWDLGRPAFWLDESASVVATQRTWPDLWLLLRGSDAPLVPYYTVLKVLTGLGTHVDPGLWHHPEVMYRWPSVLAVSLALWVLTFWLARTQSMQLAFGTAFCLLLTGGLSRYGQEARPYAMVLLLAVISTAIWAKLVSHRGWGLRTWAWLTGYAVTIAMLTTLHALAASLLVVHLVAALVAPGRGRRWRTFVKTLLGGAVGVVAVLRLVLTMAAHGKGATNWPPLTAENLWTAFLRLFTYSDPAWLGIGPILVLAVLGMTRVFSDRYGFVARLALCWAALPPLVLLPAVFIRPNLLIGRYLLFVVPAWALLAGLGVATIAEVTRRLASAGIRRALHSPVFSLWGPGDWSVLVPVPGVRPIMHTGLTGRTGAVLDRTLDAVARLVRPRTLRLRFRLAWTAWALAGAVTAVVLALTANAQVESLTVVRGPAGHDNHDIRPALDEANWPQWSGLPIVTTSNLQIIQAPAYDRADDARLAGITVQRAGANIWPAADGNLRKQVLQANPRVVLLLHETIGMFSGEGCPPANTVVPPDSFTPISLLQPVQLVETCMPLAMQRMHYRVIALEPSGESWGFAVLDRTPLPGSAASDAARPGTPEQDVTTTKRAGAYPGRSLNPGSKQAQKLRRVRPGAQ